MSTRTPQNAELVRGTTKILRVAVKDASGAVVDLAGASGEYVVARKVPTKATPVISKTVGAGIEVTDAANGEIEITLAPADSAGLGGTYYHECFLTDVAGRRARIFEGTLSVLDSVA